MIRAISAVLCCFAAAAPALAWDAHGHRTITLLAIDQFEKSVSSPKGGPADEGDGDVAGPPVPAELAWLFGDDGRGQAAYQSGEPDRYRAIRSPFLKHENDPDHYLDVEDLEQFGLTLATIPPLRYEYLRAMAIAKHEHPENARPYNERTDTARTLEWPGYLPYAIVEHHAKLVASFRQVRVLVSLNDPARSAQLAAARANVAMEMGHLSHFVGDAAQPLHTTQHHHGWVGSNPEGFTTNYGFHSYIDGTVLGIHALSHDTLKGAPLPERTVDDGNPFPDTIAHIQRSFDQVRPLYVLQKSGELEKEAGRAFIAERLADGAAMLAAYYASAWRASAMTEKEVADFLRYDRVSQPDPNPMVEQDKRDAARKQGVGSAPADGAGGKP